MSTVHICLEDIFGVAVDCEVIFSPGDAPFFDGSSVAISGACSVRLDADGKGSVTLLPGRYAVRFLGITSTTDTLIIVVPNDEATYELPTLVIAGNWILPFRDFLQCAKNLTDVADPAAAFGAIKQAATAGASGVVQLATQAEVNTGSDPAKAITPATLAGAMGSRSATAYTLQSAAFTAVAGGQYALDTTAGSFDVTMDAALPVGKYIDFADAFGTWHTHPPTFLRNGHLMEGAEIDYADAAQGTFLRILNVGGAKGLRILESGTKPHNLTAPTITGQYVGAAFTATTGLWTGSPTGYFYQWQSSSDGATWADVTGATAGRYVPGSVLLGAFVRVEVSAANANGTSLPVPSAASAALTQAPFPPGTVAFYNLDEESGTRADATGNGNDLTDNNGVGFTVGVVGNAAAPGGESYGSGSDSQPWLSSSAVLNLSGDFTIASFGKAVDSTAVQVCKFDEGSGLEFYGQLIGMSIGVSGTRTVYGASFAGDNLGITNWHHYAVTRISGVVQFYLDGVAVGSPGESSDDLSGHLGIFGKSTSGGDHANQISDLFGFWERGLSPGEIASLYNNGNGLAYPA